MEKIVYFKERADTKICLLSVIYITSLLGNLALGYRYISLGSLSQSGGIFIFPISFIISDIITEVYGTDLARKLVVYGIICQLIFAIYAYFVIHLPAPDFLNNKEAYQFVFSSYLNFALASTISIWIGSKINIILLSKLSEFNGGKYFALRSLLASTAGEFLVTFISMCIANYNKMNINNLFYMIFCCFLVKTIVSFFAIWPAAIVVYKIENPKEFNDLFSVNNLLRPFSLLRNLVFVAWNAKGYIYNLESINIDNKKASLYFKGTRGVVLLSLKDLAFDFSILERMRENDVAQIGYYFAALEERGAKSIYLKNEQQDLKRNYKSELKGLNIKAVCRDGKLLIEDKINEIIFKKYPIDLLRHKIIVNNFTTSQALYIGYLAGISERLESKTKIKTKNIAHLQLVN